MRNKIQFASLLLASASVLFGACDTDDWYLSENYKSLTDSSHGGLMLNQVVATGEAINVTQNSATILFSANYDYKKTLEIEPGIVYSDVSFNPNSSTYQDLNKLPHIKISSFNNSALKIKLDNLKSNSNYYYCAYAITSHGNHYGDVKTFTTEANYSPGDAVDLGLSVKWASYNVGASHPEEDGVKFYWGGTEPTSEAYNADWHDFSLSTLKSQGYIDSNNNLYPKYDAATQKWGSKWRMPTEKEIQELIDKCSWKRTTKNGETVYLVTGPNSNVIYMPDNGYCWSSTADGNQAYYLYICSYNVHYSGEEYTLSRASRSLPRYIRPVSKY